MNDSGAVALSVGGSVAGGAVLLAAGAGIARLRTRELRRFWKGYERDFVIMTAEYAIGDILPEGASGDAKVARTATSGVLISYGMSMAVAHLVAYFRRVRGCSPEVIGDKAHHGPRRGRSLIVLGSPAVNVYLKTFLIQFGSDFPGLKRFAWQTTPDGVQLTLPGGDALTPKIDDQESGVDYALVAHMPLDRGGPSRLVMISGCNMWATEAAAQFLTTANQMRQLPAPARDPHRPVAFVLEALIHQGRPDQVRLIDVEGAAAFPLT